MAGAVGEVTDNNFQAEVIESEVPVLVGFWALCGPCRAVAPVVEEIANEKGDALKVVKLNIDENQKTAVQYNVMSIPTLILFKHGEAAKTVIGAYPKNKLESHSSRRCPSATGSAGRQSADPNVHEPSWELDHLIRGASGPPGSGRRQAPSSSERDCTSCSPAARCRRTTCITPTRSWRSSSPGVRRSVNRTASGAWSLAPWWRSRRARWRAPDLQSRPGGRSRPGCLDDAVPRDRRARVDRHHADADRPGGGPGVPLQHPAAVPDLFTTALRLTRSTIARPANRGLNERRPVSAWRPPRRARQAQGGAGAAPLAAERRDQRVEALGPGHPFGCGHRTDPPQQRDQAAGIRSHRLRSADAPGAATASPRAWRRSPAGPPPAGPLLGERRGRTAVGGPADQRRHAAGRRRVLGRDLLQVPISSAGHRDVPEREPAVPEQADRGVAVGLGQPAARIQPRGRRWPAVTEIPEKRSAVKQGTDTAVGCGCR